MHRKKLSMHLNSDNESSSKSIYFSRYFLCFIYFDVIIHQPLKKKVQASSTFFSVARMKEKRHSLKSGPEARDLRPGICDPGILKLRPWDLKFATLGHGTLTHGTLEMNPETLRLATNTTTV